MLFFGTQKLQVVLEGGEQMSDFEKAIEFEVNQNLILYKKTFGKEFSLLRSDGVVTGIKCEEGVIFRGNFNGCLNFILGMTKCLELLGKK